MSSFTNHTGISPTDNWKWLVNKGFSYYYIDENWVEKTVDVPEWYESDWTTMPSLIVWLIWFILMYCDQYILWFIFIMTASLIQKVEPDTITSSCMHDYIFTDDREMWLMYANKLYFQSLFVKNILKLKDEKKYIGIVLYLIKYILMYLWLMIWSWFVWYKLEKKIRALFR